MKIFTVKLNDLEFGYRLLPMFYYFLKIIKVRNIKKGIKYITLQEISKKISDGEHSHIKRNNKSGVRYLYGRNIKQGTINFDSISDYSYISLEDYTNFKRTHLIDNDVLISILGTIGNSAIYKKEYLGIIGIPRHIGRITLLNTAPISPEYLVAYFRTKLAKHQLYSLTTGNIQQLLSLKNLKNYEIPIPNKTILKTVTNNELTAFMNDIFAQKEIKKAIELFYKELNINFLAISKKKNFSITYDELKNSDIWNASFYNPVYVDTMKELKKNHNIKNLGEIVDMISGIEPGSNNYINYIDKKNDSLSFIRTSDIVNHEADLYPDYYLSSECNKLIKQDIKVNDLIFTKDGKIGAVGLITNADNIFISSGVKRLRLNSNGINIGLTPEYLFIALLITEIGQYASKRRTVIATTIPHLREEKMKDIEIPIFSSDVILKITELVKKAYELKSKRKCILKETDNLLNSYFLK